jgi:hypothetical protein
MSDQVAEQSPHSRLEAMLGDSVESDVKPPELQDEEEEQTPLEADTSRCFQYSNRNYYCKIFVSYYFFKLFLNFIYCFNLFHSNYT